MNADAIAASIAPPAIMRAEIAHTFIALASSTASWAAANCSAAAASTRLSFI